MNNKTFIVAPGRVAWSNKDQKHYYEGEIIDVSHLTGEELATVLASGVIIEKEGTHGKTNTDKTDRAG